MDTAMLGWLDAFLLRCIVVNYIILIAWFVAFVFAHDALYRLHARWFKLSREQFDAIHYAGMAIYKIAVLVLCVAPWLALRMMR